MIPSLLISGACLLCSNQVMAEQLLHASSFSGSNVNLRQVSLQQTRSSQLPHQLKLSHDLASPEDIALASLTYGLNDDDLKQAKAIARKHFKRSWDLVSKRSRYVRHRLVEALKQQNAPLTLQVIPVVESTYSPYALSHAGAVGLWQLMPGTAKSLGVKSGKKADGSRNMDSSTRAAAQYLMRLHDRFDNWPLAIAAYNLGPNGLSRRLKKQPWEIADGLDRLPIPTATRLYVKHIIGLAGLLQDGQISFPEAIKTRPVDLKPPVDIHLLASLSGIEKNDIFRFNPSLNLAQYLAESVTIHVPESKHEQVKENISQSGPKFVYATVKKGNSMWSIAKAHGTDVRTIKQLNRGTSNVLRIGQKLKVPANQLAKASANINPLLPSNRRIRYKVRSGDSLWGIANRFGTTVKAIARVNSLSRKAIIRSGDILWVLARVRPS